MSSIEKHKGHVDDDAQLAAMGHKAELDRNFSMLYEFFFFLDDDKKACLLSDYWRLLDFRSMLGLAFAILNVRLFDSTGFAISHA